MMRIYGTIVEEDGVFPGRITIEEGRIAQFEREPQADFKTGKLVSYAEYRGRTGLPEFIVFPGFIDTNCYEPEQLAGYNGGVTTIKSGHHIQTGDFADNKELSSHLRGKEKAAFKWRDPQKLVEHPHDSPICEIEGVRTAITMTKVHNLRSRVVVSTLESLELVQQAKGDGWNIMTEIHPCNLYFDTTMVTPENKRSLRSNPPIRSEEDRKGLLKAFMQGKIDILSSGHYPNELSDNRPGVPELDTFGSVVAWLVTEGVSPKNIFAAACKNPAEWYDLEGVGRIKEGYNADLTVVAFNKPAIDCRRLYTFCGWSPYDLRHLKGSVEMVMVKGEKVVNGPWITD